MDASWLRKKIPAENKNAQEKTAIWLAQIYREELRGSPNCETLIERGELFEHVLRAVREHQVDVLVLSAHTHEGFHLHLISNLPEKLVRKAAVNRHRELHATFTPSKNTTFIARYDGDFTHRAPSVWSALPERSPALLREPLGRGHATIPHGHHEPAVRRRQFSGQEPFPCARH